MSTGARARIERALGWLLARNNRLVRDHAVDRLQANPRPLAGVAWSERLEATHAAIRAEWDDFVARGGGLPRIEDLIAEDQGNTGVWRAGLLVSKGRPVTKLAEEFPVTVDALRHVPGLWSALWSVLEPGAELPPHSGPNAGVVRYHLGVDCGEGAALEVGGEVHPYRDGVGILFDDTETHAAWNRGDAPRVTLFLEIRRAMPLPWRLANEAFQRVLSLDARYREAPKRADAHHRQAG